MKKSVKKTAVPDLTKVTKNGWTYGDKRIGKTFAFKNFDDAFCFMARSALAIVELDHHPEWFNVFNKVHVELTTHSAGGVTGKDCELALLMDKIAGPFLKKTKKKAK